MLTVSIFQYIMYLYPSKNIGILERGEIMIILDKYMCHMGTNEMIINNKRRGHNFMCGSNNKK